jgi:hypothetical protein
MWVKIFKAGTYQDKNGEPRVYDEQALDKIVKDYDPKLVKAPATIGPITDDSPAWAWVKSLKREGDTLHAELDEVIPEFEAMLNAGAFPKRSISFTPFGLLSRVGFLGAAPPKIPGLNNMQFSRGSYETAEFSTVEFGSRGFSQVDDPGKRLSELTRAKMEGNKDLSFCQAFAEVQIENQILTEEYFDVLRGE